MEATNEFLNERTDLSELFAVVSNGIRALWGPTEKDIEDAPNLVVKWVAQTVFPFMTAADEQQFTTRFHSVAKWSSVKRFNALMRKPALKIWFERSQQRRKVDALRPSSEEAHDPLAESLLGDIEERVAIVEQLVKQARTKSGARLPSKAEIQNLYGQYLVAVIGLIVSAGPGVQFPHRNVVRAWMRCKMALQFRCELYRVSPTKVLTRLDKSLSERRAGFDAVLQEFPAAEIPPLSIPEDLDQGLRGTLVVRASGRIEESQERIEGPDWEPSIDLTFDEA